MAKKSRHFYMEYDRKNLIGNKKSQFFTQDFCSKIRYDTLIYERTLGCVAGTDQFSVLFSFSPRIFTISLTVHFIY